jgi:hypothetical protein
MSTSDGDADLAFSESYYNFAHFAKRCLLAAYFENSDAGLQKTG